MRVAKILLVLCFACSSSSGIDAGPAPQDATLDSTSSMDAGGPLGDVGPAADSGGADSGGVDSGGADSGTDAGGEDVGSGPAQCSADNLCEGACTGRSCSATWFCVADVPCTDDIATFCGCDGTTFTGSSSCPSRPFASMGPCPSRDGLRCDRRDVTCRTLPPECDFGFVPEVTDSGDCWTGRCVAVGECGCSSPEECSDPDNYTCRNDMGRCTPFL